jgi:hypothetical protein
MLHLEGRLAPWRPRLLLMVVMVIMMMLAMERLFASFINSWSLCKHSRDLISTFLHLLNL